MLKIKINCQNRQNSNCQVETTLIQAEEMSHQSIIVVRSCDGRGKLILSQWQKHAQNTPN